MARLFITPREMNFISDITKEIIKDINGQKIFLFPISEIKTDTHDVYNESINKIFDNPIAVDALVDAQYQEPTKINAFGVDAVYKIEVFVQYRDLVDKELKINIGDFFSFSDTFYEITSVQVLKNIFGQAEHRGGVKIVGTKARQEQFDSILHGPTDLTYTDDDAVQKKFIQQRGEAETPEGETGDKRELIEQEVLEKPLTGVKEVSERGGEYASSFYDDE